MLYDISFDVLLCRIQVASIVTGEIRRFTHGFVLRIRAPSWRHFYETPGLQTQDDMIGIAAGRLYSDERDRRRLMDVTVVNFRTERVEAVSSLFSCA